MWCDGIYTYAKCHILSEEVIPATLAHCEDGAWTSCWLASHAVLVFSSTNTKYYDRWSTTSAPYPGGEPIQESIRMSDQDENGKRTIRTFATVIGLVLFVAGFLLTISSLSKTYVSESDGDSSNGLLGNDSYAPTMSTITMLGLLSSLAGIMIATVGPAFAAFHRRS